MSWFSNKVKEEAEYIAEQTEKTMVGVVKDTEEAVVSGAKYVGEGIKETAEIGAYYVEQDAQALAQGAKVVGEAISSAIPESVVAVGETVVTDAAIIGMGAVAIAAIPEEAVAGAVGAVGLAGAEVSDAVLGTKIAPTVIKAGKYAANLIAGGVTGAVISNEMHSDSKEVIDLKTQLNDKQKQLDDTQKQLDDLKASSQKQLDDLKASSQKQLDDKQKQIDALIVDKKIESDKTQKSLNDKDKIANLQEDKINLLQDNNKLLKEKLLEKGTPESTQPNKTTEPKKEDTPTEKPLTPKELMVHMTYHRDALNKTDDDKQQDYHLAQMENICAQIAELTGHTPMKGAEQVAQVEPSQNQNQNQGMSR